MTSEGVKRWSMDCKATVKIGDFSRGGQTRGDNQALDHDLGWEEKYIPCGIVDEDCAQLDLSFGSSYKTSDFIVDTLEAKWNRLEEQEKAEVSKLQIKMDNGPERVVGRPSFSIVWCSLPMPLASRSSCYIIRPIIANIIRLSGAGVF